MPDERDVARALLGSWPGTVSAWGREGIAAYLSELEARGAHPEAVLLAIRSWPPAEFPPSAPSLARAAVRAAFRELGRSGRTDLLPSGERERWERRLLRGAELLQITTGGER